MHFAGPRRARRRWSPLATALAMPAVSLIAVSAPAASAQTASDIEARDSLIANQENLLNSYRCLFGVDTEVVPGRCPSPDRVSPGVAPENPTQNDIDVRDQLIQSQEELLNVYRCRFDIDTHIVPGGCPDTPALEELAFVSGSDTSAAALATAGGLSSIVQVGRSGYKFMSIAWSADGTRAVVDYPASEDSYGTVIEDPRAGLFVVRSDGTELWRITLTGGEPAWSPDGLWIAYSDNDGEWVGDHGGFGVYVVSADGIGTRRPIGDWRGGTDPVWSPDGARIMFDTPTGPFSSGLAVAPSGGGDAWVIDPYCEESDDPEWPYPTCIRPKGAWSPDGRRIAYSVGGDIYVVNADGTGKRRLVSGGDDPVWSPNGQWVAYVSTSGASGGSSDGLRHELRIVNPEGGASRSVSTVDLWGSVAWSPDSTRLAYVAEPGNASGVIMVSTLANDAGTVAVSPPGSSSPVWSQDSKRIAFSSPGNAQLNPGGDAEIFVVNSDGTNLMQVTNNDVDDYRPVWIPANP